MVKRLAVKRNTYYDSVFLMHGARRIGAVEGIADAAVLMATDANRRILAGMGYDAATLEAARPDDLLFAVEGESAAVEAALADPTRWLVPSGGARAATQGAAVGSIEEATARNPRAGVAVISVPGEHAAREARRALVAGLNVFLFSSNVSVEDEVALKREARERGLIVMGPDCGTAIVSGVGIGFSNAVRRGVVGIVASSGTGLQELTCLLHRGGGGVSHAIGTGGRDLSDAVGGISTYAALEALEGDASTGVICILSKPPGARATAELLARVARCTKPVVVCLLGATREGLAKAGRLALASTIDDAAELCLHTGGAAPSAAAPVGVEARVVTGAPRAAAPVQRYLRGIFAGGTFCYQAQAIARDAGLTVWSNGPLEGMRALPDPMASREHALVDMGAEELVQGRAHPMIDASLRRRRLEQEADDPEVAVILLDVILGTVSSPDPAGELAPAIARGRERSQGRGGELAVFASVCGTELDAQGYEAQVRKLEQSGAAVFPSAARAARAAVAAVKRIERRVS